MSEWIKCSDRLPEKMTNEEGEIKPVQCITEEGDQHMRNMTSEEYLLFVLKSFRLGLEGNALCACENDDKPSIFMEGYVDGLRQSIGALDASLRLYEAFKNMKLPKDMLEIDDDYE